MTLAAHLARAAVETRCGRGGGPRREQHPSLVLLAALPARELRINVELI